jgi:hypothetical protein
MKGRWICALVVVVAAGAAYAGNVLATGQTGSVTTTILGKSLFDGIAVNAKTIPADTWKAELKTRGQSDVYVVDNKLAPVDPKTGIVSSTGWHKHPGPSLILVIAGTVTNYTGDDPSCTGHAYNAGQGFIDSGTDVHILRNEGNVQAETIAVQLLPRDAPRKIDVTPGPDRCPF